MKCQMFYHVEYIYLSGYEKVAKIHLFLCMFTQYLSCTLIFTDEFLMNGLT
jgi:hypothetical protein